MATTSHLPWAGSIGDVPTVVHAMDKWARAQPSKVAYTWVNDKCKSEKELTYAELLSSAQNVEYHLVEKWKFAQGDRAVMIYPIGLNFVVAFWGCLRAGVVAVPLYPPAPASIERDLIKLSNAVTDCRPHGILTDSEYKRAVTYMNSQALMKGRLLKWPDRLTWHPTDNLSPRPPITLRGESTLSATISPDDMAFIQYTSGSTSEPKGVMVLHKNLVANLAAAFSGLQVYPNDVLVTWLPQYHDLGLIGFFIDAIVVGASCVAFSPFTFVRRPHFWMKVMHHFNGTVTSGPNFGYALAARKTTPEEVEGLDLSRVRILMDAAEPVRQVHVKAFLDRYADAGLPPRAYMPGYGLAEHVIFVTGLKKIDSEDAPENIERAGPTFLSVRKQLLEEQSIAEIVPLVEEQAMKDEDISTQLVHLVGCGLPFGSVRVLCVDPRTCMKVQDGNVGEIWVSGPSVAKGYWNKPDLTKSNFQAQLQGSPAQMIGSKAGDTDDAGLEDISQVNAAPEYHDEEVCEDDEAVLGTGTNEIDNGYGGGSRGRTRLSADDSLEDYQQAYLRTGDLGFFHDGELFVCGREKDLIIIGGRNICPKDIEFDIEDVHKRIRKGCSAAFSVVHAAEERLVIVSEVREVGLPDKALREIATSINAAVQQCHKLSVYALLLLPPRAICKTTSGKIQRKRCQQWFLSGNFKPIYTQGSYQYRAPPSKTLSSQDVSPSKTDCDAHHAAVDAALRFAHKHQFTPLIDLFNGRGDLRAATNILLTCVVLYLLLWMFDFFALDMFSSRQHLMTSTAEQYAVNMGLGIARAPDGP